MVGSLAEDWGQYAPEANLLPMRSRLKSIGPLRASRWCIECPRFGNMRIMMTLVTFDGDLRRRTKCHAHVRGARARPSSPLHLSAMYTSTRSSAALKQTTVCNARTAKIRFAPKNQVFAQMGYTTLKGSPNLSPALFSVAQRPWTLSIEERCLDSPL
jgi:hypothetical protein